MRKKIPDESEVRWKKDKERYKWELPRKAPFLFRLPIMRWLRGAIYAWRIQKWAGSWASVGIGFGEPNQYDLWVLYAIRRGWC